MGVSRFQTARDLLLEARRYPPALQVASNLWKKGLRLGKKECQLIHTLLFQRGFTFHHVHRKGGHGWPESEFTFRPPEDFPKPNDVGYSPVRESRAESIKDALKLYLDLWKQGLVET